MPATKSHLAYGDAKEILQQALESPSGLRLTFASEKAAKSFRFNLYTVRKRDREQLKKILPVSDPNWGTSPFDVLSIYLEERKSTSAPFTLIISRAPTPYFIQQLSDGGTGTE